MRVFRVSKKLLRMFTHTNTHTLIYGKKNYFHRLGRFRKTTAYTDEFQEWSLRLEADSPSVCSWEDLLRLGRWLRGPQFTEAHGNACEGLAPSGCIQPDQRSSGLLPGWWNVHFPPEGSLLPVSLRCLLICAFGSTTCSTLDPRDGVDTRTRPPPRALPRFTDFSSFHHGWAFWSLSAWNWDS